MWVTDEEACNLVMTEDAYSSGGTKCHGAQRRSRHGNRTTHLVIASPCNTLLGSFLEHINATILLLPTRPT